MRGNCAAGPWVYSGGRRKKFMEATAMSALSFRTTRPDAWLMPRPPRDASLRYLVHGPIRPMEEPGFLARLFGAR
jgi:hypothetical protein